MNAKFNLYKDLFSTDERVVFESGSLKASIFKYSTGIEAVKLENEKGAVVLLPFMGQMVWRAEFLGHALTMKSIYEEPEVCKDFYGESYGCFLMHCGLTAMGNPTAEDTHTPHGELPIAKYKEAYIIAGEDEKGKYVSLGGVYTHKRAFELDYEFSPECRLYEGASVIDEIITFKNNKDLPLEYFYLCHVNHRPVDGSKLYYTAKHENIVAHHEVPENYPEDRAKKTNDYLARLDNDMSLVDTVDKASQSYDPEIVFTCKYDADESGVAHTMQLLPDGYACYVNHRPSELPFGVRWIARTIDEDALGMVLPATAEHMGYLYCKSKGQEKYLAPGESMTLHISTGLLNPEESKKMKEKIEKIKK